MTVWHLHGNKGILADWQSEAIRRWDENTNHTSDSVRWHEPPHSLPLTSEDELVLPLTSTLHRCTHCAPVEVVDEVLWTDCGSPLVTGLRFLTQWRLCVGVGWRVWQVNKDHLTKGGGLSQIPSLPYVFMRALLSWDNCSCAESLRRWFGCVVTTSHNWK